MNQFLEELRLLTAEGGWIFGGLLVLAFGIAFSLLSLFRLLSFPEAPKLANSSWVGLFKREEFLAADLREVRALAATESAVEELERVLFGKLRLRLPFAFTLISAAPLLGLLGTVSGMFNTFHGMSSSATRSPVDVISGGISEALITTQAGLVIGVPAFIIASLLKARVNRRQLAFRRLISAAAGPYADEDPPETTNLSYSHA
ncbi:MAG: MotA/TolQ/ExbB proton channel family protein [Verrucomicrobiota bacterium]